VRLAWATDIHLNFLHQEELEGFFSEIVAAGPDALVITGDIGEADSIKDYLLELEQVTAIPIYFVLGNHDYYGGSISRVRTTTTALCRSSKRLCWLPDAGVVALSKETALVGHDGWADGRFGDYAGSKVLLNDFIRIQDFVGLDKTARLLLMRTLADQAADHVRALLPEALDRFQDVIVATHVPPFCEACWHEGNISGPEWLPHFSSRSLGEVVLDAARTYPDRSITVLCGHTHGSGVTRPFPNVEVWTGGATYGIPVLQAMIDLP
jgi:predicted phosphohydrolase